MIPCVCSLTTLAYTVLMSDHRREYTETHRKTQHRQTMCVFAFTMVNHVFATIYKVWRLKEFQPLAFYIV